MDIRVTQEQGRLPITVVHVTGSVHLGTADQFEQSVRGVIEQGARYVVVDLANVPSMTSAGLRVLNVLYKALGASGGREASGPHMSQRLKLANPTPQLRRVLSIAGFDKFLEVHESVPAAVASFP